MDVPNPISNPPPLPTHAPMVSQSPTHPPSKRRMMSDTTMIFLFMGVLLVATVLFILLFPTRSNKVKTTPISVSQNTSKTSSTATTKPTLKKGEVPLTNQYQNPFDKNTQYVNPFADYKNPFDSLK